ncbi:MBL fold metallo-hydrolase [Caproiciproducens sp. NJN-50]|nr:MBL fold metallo-hydrolase [Caproiciproducens sp. NJN-50]
MLSPLSVTLSPEEYMRGCCDRPWEWAIRPFRVTPHVYYVSGNTWVGCYLFDTGDGLILLDTAMQPSLYMLLSSIDALGYHPKDIKTILLSHAHYDHCGGAKGMQELTGAKTYLGERDLEFMEHPELIYPDRYPYNRFNVDELYRDDKPIQQGRFTIHTLSTPGHTPGCTSFFFEDTDERTNRTYRCAMHGGVGLNTLADDYFITTGQPVTLRREYRESIIKCSRYQVDIAIGSHPNQTNMLEHLKKNSGCEYPQYDQDAWMKMIRFRLSQLTGIESESKLEF